jgi:hypothetical protein
VQRLYLITQAGGLFVDDQGLILEEYTHRLGHSGQPGAGEKFVKWVFNNQSTPTAVSRVTVTPRHDGGWRQFEEFPDQEALKTFDRNDQKFVAVAIGSGENPPILNAVDSDWRDHFVALTAAGVTIEFLCPHHVDTP